MECYWTELIMAWKILSQETTETLMVVLFSHVVQLLCSHPNVAFMTLLLTNKAFKAIASSTLVPLQTREKTKGEGGHTSLREDISRADPFKQPREAAKHRCICIG